MANILDEAGNAITDEAGNAITDEPPAAAFTVTVTDAALATASASLTISIGASAQPPAITTTSLPPGVVGVPYTATLGSSGGTPPDTWSRTGALPPGLSLASHGQTATVSGTPTTAGTYSPAFTVTDSVPSSSPPKTLPITITATVPQVIAHTPAVPGSGQPGGFQPGRQGTLSPLNPLSTTAVPATATPGTFSPADPGTTFLPPPPVPPPFSFAQPGQAQPGIFTPGDPGLPVFLFPAGPFIAQQVSSAFTFNYGWSATEFSGNAAGNMLVVIAGWDLNATASSAPMPAAYVCDSALNYWYHAGTTSADNTGSRCAIWVAPNARPVDWVSCSLTGFTSSLAYTILEIGNAPQFFSLDVSAGNSGTKRARLSANPGPAGAAAIGFTVLAAGSATNTLAVPPAGWVPLATAQAGAGEPNGITLWPFWDPAVPAGTSEGASYTVLDSAALSALTVMIEAAPYPPVQPAPGLPVLKVEAAFGFLPGDPSAPPPQWTDITSRCASKDGTPFIEASMGRSYELAAPETGTLAISCDNHDGAFTPGNPASPFYPGVVLGTPVRVSAHWAGSWYNIAFGYVERWPQEWPDMPQWGMSVMVAADAFSALSAATSYSALAGDLLLDAPYALIPCNETYETHQNSLNTVNSPSECQGLLAANIARGNQRAGTYVDGTGAQAQTGQSTALLGSTDTGFGCGSFTAPLTSVSSGPGMIYADPGLPSPVGPSSMTAEFWLTIPAASPAANQQPVVFTAFAAASNYQTARPALQVQVQNFTGNNQLQVSFATGTSLSVPFSPSPNPQQVVLLFEALGSFGATTASVYVNGALAGSAALTPAKTGGPWVAVMLGCGAYAYHNGSLQGGVFTAGSLAIYGYALPVQRIVSHYVTGVSGQQNVDATTRIAQVLAWNNLGVPRGGQVTFGGITPGILQGPAYSLAGSNVSAAVGQAVTNEMGMAFASPDGTLQFMHRWALFNQAPAEVFGDNEDAGEIPFLPGQAFDYDNSHLVNIDQVQQSQGPTTGIKVSGTDTASEASYFARSPLQIAIQTMSNLDAYDIANQVTSTYSQPQIRVRGLTVDAATNPLAAFPGVLSLQQGNAATVNRRPVGAAPISATVLVQKVAHSIGPAMWRASYEMSPYVLGSVLQLDAPGFDLIGSNALP